MTINHVELFAETGSRDKSGSTYERTYAVYYSGEYSHAALQNTTYVGLPHAIGIATHPDDDTTLLRSVTPQLADGEGGAAAIAGHSVAFYKCAYSPLTGDSEEDPRDKAPVISWGGSELTEVAKKDINGKPLINSAGDLYTDLPERAIRGGECSITIVMEHNPAEICVNYSYTTNAGTWFGVGEDNGFFGKLSANQQFATYRGDKISWWELTVPIRFRRDSWALKLIDCGYRKLTESGKQINATDEMGQQPSVAVLLDGEGNILPPDSDPVLFPEAGYKIVEQISWGGIGLPSPFA